VSALFVERYGAGRRVVLLHGFTQTGRSWTTLIDDLARDHEVVTIDAPGHGGSHAMRVDLAGAADLVAEIGQRASYVGYSMGGRLALHVAVAHPHLVERLVLLSATAGIDDDDGERAARQASDDALATTIERDGVEAFLSRWLAQPMFAALADDQAARHDRLRNTAAGLASSLRLAGTGAQEPLWPHLGELTMPVDVVAGGRDAKFVALGQRLAATIGANATFTTIDGAGHAAHLEQPAAFAALVRRALAPD
jgi:2-succinyl-6-hydroxy-2,4-cyclohexadiene-1-carboxylate synthase